MFRTPEQGLQAADVVGQRALFTGGEGDGRQRDATVERFGGSVVADVGGEVEGGLLRAAVADRHLKCGTVQPGLDIDILHAYLIINYKAHGLPDAGRVVAIEAVGYLREQVLRGLVLLDVLRGVVAGRGIMGIQQVVEQPALVATVLRHLYVNLILASVEQAGAVDVERAEHTDVRAGQRAVDIDLGSLRHGIEVERQLTVVDVGGQRQQLALSLK